jgi:GTP cyclohydrolase II
MKKVNKHRGLIIAVTICALLLSACSDDEWDLIGEFFIVWAEENEIVIDDEIQTENVINNILKDKIGDLTNSEKNVQLDGLDVIRDIEQANAIADKALESMNPDQMLSAVNLRPNDWRLREKDGVIWLANGNTAAAESAFERSDTLLKVSLTQNGGDCLSARRAQLETRLETLWDAITRYESVPGYSGSAVELRQEHTHVLELLSDINTYSESPFCGD